MQTPDGLIGTFSATLMDLTGLSITDWLTVILVALQFAVDRLYLRKRTLAALATQQERLRQDRRTLATASAPTTVQRDQVSKEVFSALAASYPNDPIRVQQSLHESFSSEHLLPAEYNARLDTAIPGIFTAFGIIGTFLGLLVTFLTINFSDPTNSIAPLISGMRIAFVNSLVGVALALWWTIKSRNARHAHDLVAHDLVETVRERFGYVGGDQQVLKALGEIGGAIKGQYESTKDGLAMVKKAVDDSAEGVQRNLAGTLEKLVEKMVAMPFEALSGHINTFGELVRKSSEAHSQSHGVLVDSVSALEKARDVLSAAVSVSAGVTAQLTPLLDGFKAQTEAASNLVGQAGEAAKAGAATLDNVRAQLDRQEALTTALTGTTDALAGEATGLKGVADEFRGAAQQLAGAVTQVKAEVPAAVQQAANGIADTLTSTTVALKSALAEAAQKAVDGQVAAVADSIQATKDSVGQVMSALVGASESAANAVRTSNDAMVGAAQKAVDGQAIAVNASVQATKDSVDQVMVALQAAAKNATDAMGASASKTASELAGSSSAVVEAFAARAQELKDELDTQFTELAQRITAELGQHTDRLPEAANEIVRAVADVKSKLNEALRNLSATLHRTNADSTEALKQRLHEFDQLLANAVSHMNGTIGTWDDHMNKLDQPFTHIAQEIKALQDYRTKADDTLVRLLASVNNGNASDNGQAS